ncbi:MAG: D-alanyl-D-alanine carboxypeptidase family protein, partial [Candidatus Parcubacteria bacterium]|nr:D-alanyl-D-alanine carboxypeptidase family protein [Candidatus Parcubacteria bacterium]
MQELFSKKVLIIAVISVVIAGGFGYLVFQYFSLNKALKEAKERGSELENNVKNLEEELFKTKEDNSQLSNLLQEEKERNDSFGRQIESITSKVGTLEKLKALDEELLKKYSRVYFLNENYAPKELVRIDEKYIYEKNETKLIHLGVPKYLYAMLEDAELNGLPLKIISAYRSFGQQDSLKDRYAVTYGSGANKFVADQGYSEHQLGTTVDFTTPKIGGSFEKIDKEPAYQWLLENAHRYG